MRRISLWKSNVTVYVIFSICFYFGIKITVDLQVLKKVARFVTEQNEKIYAPRGLLLVNPAERGLRVVSFFFVFALFSIINMCVVNKWKFDEIMSTMII